MRTPTDGHEVDLAPELGVNHGATLHERMLGAALGHEAKAKPGGNHRQDPVVTFTPVDGLTALEPMLPPECPSVAVELAIDPVEVTIAREVTGANGISLG